LLSSLRNALLAFTTLCLVNLAFALPVLRNGDRHLVSRAQGSDASAVFGRETILYSEILALREFLDGIDTNVYTRSPSGFQSVEEIQLEARKGPSGHHITVAPKAKQDIRKMLPAGHTRQDYKAAKKYHRDQVQNHMNTHGATHATITRGAHSGGSVKTEPQHITAQLSRVHTTKKGLLHSQGIKAKLTDPVTGIVTTLPKHHVYLTGPAHPGITIPHV